MELCEWATRILCADTLEEKLCSSEILTDHTPGTPIFWQQPTRPLSMSFKRHTREEKLPPLQGLGSQDNRAVCLHRFAGHELLAVEIMAYALLAFPSASKYFRRGIAHTLREEQEHVRLYIRRLSDMGITFGDLPLYRHFWAYTPYMKTPAQYVSVMSLTFEMANLDFAPMYGRAFSRYEDSLSAALMEQIYQDELSHVAFGFQWFRKYFSNEENLFKTWVQQLPPRMLPRRAKGLQFSAESRRLAGLPEEWIVNLKASN